MGGRERHARRVVVKNNEVILESYYDEILSTKADVDKKIEAIGFERERWVAQREAIDDTIEKLDIAVQELEKAKKKLPE